MKILHLIDSGGLYGAEQMLLALTEEQLKQGLDPIILSCGLPNEANKPLEIEAEKRNIPVVKWRMKAGLNFQGAWKILKLAKKEKVDILHSHGYKFNILFAIFPKFARKIPFITTVHGYVHAVKFSSNWVYQIIDKLSLRKMSKVIFVSQITRNEFSALNHSVVVQNGISVKPSNNIVPENRLKSNNIRIVAIGRLAKEKGFDYLLESIKHSQNTEYQIDLTIMGSGEYKNKLYELANKLGILEQVTFKGFVEKPSLYFNDFDFLIMPSLTEGLPITILEAMREKLPILASDVGEIPIVLKNSYPLIKSPAELPDLFSHIDSFIKQYGDKWLETSQCLYERFVKEYSSEVMANKYQKLYLELQSS